VALVKETPDQAAARAAQELTEDTLAESFEREHVGDIKYNHARKQYLLYDKDSGLWRADSTERVAHLVRVHVRALNVRSEPRFGKAQTVAGVERLVRAHPQIAVAGHEFDADPWLLGTPGGVYDLRTTEPLPHSCEHLVTKSTSVAPDPDQVPTLWMRFLAEATGNDPDVIGYIQRLFGYALTGDTREEQLTFLHGPGGNGKGVLLNVVKEIAGDYATVAGMDTFLESRNDRNSADLASLAGARIVIASESSDGRRWDDQRAKSVTGRDPVTARHLYGNFFTYVPQFKLLIASNHQPRIRTVDDAWRRRLHMLPFDKKPANPDPELKLRLRDEYPAILHWMMEGAEWWLREGLAKPETISTATTAYLRSEDIVGLWFEECCELDAAAETSRKTIYGSLERWCADMGHRAPTQHALTRWLGLNQGIEQDIRKSSRPYLGIQLRPDENLGPIQ
jgi:putative DNA primase/helicase